MRGYDLVALHAAGSGHAGGTLSIMDITAALYLHANHDPQNPILAGPRPHFLVRRAQGSRACTSAWPSRAFVRSTTWSRCANSIALSGPSALAQAARRRNLHRVAGPGSEHRRRHGAGRPAGRQEPQDLLPDGRRRTAGGPGLGSRHGGRPLPPRQPHRHRRLQPPADRRLGQGRHGGRAAGRQVRELRLGRVCASTATT